MSKSWPLLGLGCALTALAAVEVQAQSWRHFTSTDEMTGETQAFATSPRVTATRRMPFPYNDVEGWLGFGCDGPSEWAYVGFSEAPNLTDTRAREGGYSTFSTRIRWDSDVATVGMMQEWGDRFLNFRNDVEAIERMELGNTVLLELEWYGANRVHFQFPLNGSARAINRARAACGSAMPPARRRVESPEGPETEAFDAAPRVGQEVRLGTCDLSSFVPLHTYPKGEVIEDRIGRSNLCGRYALEAEVLGTQEMDEDLWVQVKIPRYGLEGWVLSNYVNPQRR